MPKPSLDQSEQLADMKLEADWRRGVDWRCYPESDIWGCWSSFPCDCDECYREPDPATGPGEPLRVALGEFTTSRALRVEPEIEEAVAAAELEELNYLRFG